ncbi:probable LRR receptor-like serine/threonine-protein kinase At3g47570 isoform X1 [Malus sylvestris]|uniref:probable LRR receptor-like serine/threonine-protein kinase At3g47570 isoform X1 n=1 Tax=Malus sylvestris TaxID=3752 RepID=UPI0021AD340F|nr:probable LRR receptor-like serine/threonine-protein kinase At3g47570 isoform X1 [Malus sylvestris]
MARTRSLLSIALLLVLSCCMYLRNSLIGTVAAQTNISTDQAALLAFKAHITSDPRNILTTNWSTTNSNICNWVGITCGVSHLRVTTVNLSYMGLRGSIPPHLGNLSFLVQLEFRNNSFHGTLPPELSRLRRLKLIRFSFNDFIGTIPSWFGLLSELQTFDLYGNQFSGFIPNAIFNLSALQVLDLRNNQLSGSIPRDVGKLKMLKEISLGDNDFTGRIPREIGNLTMLKNIYLDFNMFEEIPNLIGSKDQVEKLYVQANALKGPVPLAVFNMSSLKILALTANYLTGSIPDDLCQHLPSIQILSLARNKLDGPLPSKLWQCKELLQFSLDYNNFSGSIPKSIGNSTQLERIGISYNNLTGTIPDEIGHLKNLHRLSLHVNNLHGPIPSTIFNMSKITTISLPENQLSGNLPAYIGLGVPDLQMFYVGGNQLTGAFPNFMSNGSKLTSLDMSKNSFYGFIPTKLCLLKTLEYLSLGTNNLAIDTSTPEVNIPSCFANLTNLRGFHLSNNPLNTTLPVSFGSISTLLEHLDISNCNLRGNIPSDIGNLSNLRVLDLGDNEFGGSIPTSVGRLGKLQGLYLNDNKLQGYIPYELCQLDNVAELLLGGNQLSGSIPSCLGNLAKRFRVLSLQSNFLSSTIPSTLWELTDILYLNLSFNSLFGPLSEDIGKLKVVTIVDLSNNNLSGILPSSIGQLQNLLKLSLSTNGIEGPIPITLGKMTSLEQLDLSKNNLSGVIPKSLEALSHLKNLNLSSNRLQGEIPTGGPFQNFSAQSFVSNALLCGVPRLQVPLCKSRTDRKPHSKKAGTSTLKYIIPGFISAIILVAIALMLIRRRKKNVQVVTSTTWSPEFFWRSISRLELVRATNGFHESNLLGAGGFGSVYRGTLSDGIHVAVKVFNLQVEGAFKSYERECEMLSNIRHRNLIKIISCCSQIDFKAMILNYMPNGSLEKWLYSQNSSLNILQRLNIMIDVALALEYLHHGYSIPVVHCDVKPSNILLDEDMVAHVADFGIAKLGGGDYVTHTMTLATIGYMAPEYGTEGIVSTRGDVYSFGIVLMETFTKRKPTDEMFVEEMSLKQWVSNSLLSDSFSTVVDANLLGMHEEDHDFETCNDCLSSIMRLSLACAAESPEGRINMLEAVSTLKKIKMKILENAARGVRLNLPVLPV